jgi:hypothetical protein
VSPFVPIIYTVSIVSSWVVAHTVAAHAYVHFCAPTGFAGFVKTAVLTPAPHCEAIAWVVTRSRVQISDGWLLLGTLAATMIATAAVKSAIKIGPVGSSRSNTITTSDSSSEQ